MTTMISNLFDFDSYCEIIKSNVEDSEKFEIVLRTKFNKIDESYHKTCDEWVKLFSMSSKTNWIVRNTFPNMKLFEYRKDYVCQHSSWNKVLGTNIARNRNKGCNNALIKIHVKKNTKDTRKKDVLIRRGLNAEIKVSNRKLCQ